MDMSSKHFFLVLSTHTSVIAISSVLKPRYPSKTHPLSDNDPVKFDLKGQSPVDCTTSLSPQLRLHHGGSRKCLFFPFSSFHFHIPIIWVLLSLFAFWSAFPNSRTCSSFKNCFPFGCGTLVEGRISQQLGRPRVT